MSPKSEEEAVTISVESKDPPPKDEPIKIKELKDDDPKLAMSEEDQELKDRLETCVNTLINKDAEEAVTIPIRLKALDMIVSELRSATSSMTSVPKPLKFLRPHYVALKDLYATLGNDVSITTDVDSLLLRARLADVLSVLAMTMGADGEYRK
jgi:26S proteasome regulatory subunit N1